MKLILSAAQPSASIGLIWAVQFGRTTDLGWQDAVVEMGGRAGVMEVVAKERND